MIGALVGAAAKAGRTARRKAPLERQKSKTERLKAKKRAVSARAKAAPTDKEKVMSAGRRRAKAQGGADSRRNAGNLVKSPRPKLGKKAKLEEKVTKVKSRLERSKAKDARKGATMKRDASKLKAKMQRQKAKRKK